MYLNFSNFRGQTSAGGGQALVQKRGQVSDGGGIGKIFAGWGDPPVPPQEKNPAVIGAAQAQASFCIWRISACIQHVCLGKSYDYQIWSSEPLTRV